MLAATRTFTRCMSLLMGRVSHDSYNNVVKVALPRHKLNEVLLLYVRKGEDVLALDENNICKPGDWILLRKEASPIDEKVPYKVERVVYEYGRYIDPLNDRRSLGLYYDDDMEKLEQIKYD